MNNYSSGILSGVVKPKYRVISAILGEEFNPTNGMDVFIDLNSFVAALSTSKKYQASLPFAENAEEDLLSSMLMILKHWKDYTRKWEDVRIFMMVNDFEMVMLAEETQLKSYMMPYVHKYTNERFKQFIYYWNEAIKKVEIILKYVPNSYIIRCNRFDSFVLPNIIDDEHKRERVIISGSALMTNYHYLPHTHIIYSRYKFTGMTQVSDPKMIVQSITKIDNEIVETFVMNKVFYNLLNTIVGDFDRGLIGLTQMGISKFATTLLRAVEKRDIPDNPKSVETVLPVINPNFHDYIRQSYPLVDIESHSMMISKSLIEKTKSKMIDLYDIDGLSKFNVQGLNLLELL